MPLNSLYGKLCDSILCFCFQVLTLDPCALKVTRFPACHRVGAIVASQFKGGRRWDGIRGLSGQDGETGGLFILGCDTVTPSTDRQLPVKHLRQTGPPGGLNKLLQIMYVAKHIEVHSSIYFIDKSFTSHDI
jgi:hypothetical protein